MHAWVPTAKGAQPGDGRGQGMELFAAEQSRLLRGRDAVAPLASSSRPVWGASVAHGAGIVMHSRRF